MEEGAPVNEEVLAVQEAVVAEETTAVKEIPTAEAVRLAADLAGAAKPALEVILGVAEFACFMISEVLIEQEKSAAFSPEAPQISTEDETTEVVLKVGEKKVSALSAQVNQVSASSIEEANAAGVAPEALEALTAEGVSFEAAKAPDASGDEEIIVEKTPDIALEAAKITIQEEWRPKVPVAEASPRASIPATFCHEKISV